MKKRKKNIPSKNKRKRKQNKERNSRRRVAKNQKRKVKKNKNKANSQKSNRKQIYSEFLQNFFGSQNYNYQDESEYSDYEDEYSYEYSENPFYPFLNDYKDHSLSRYLKDMKRYAKRTATKQPYTF